MESKTERKMEKERRGTERVGKQIRKVVER